MVGGVAAVKVGAATETEMKEKKAHVEDALNSPRAAVEDGIVAGGGTALIRAQHALDKLTLSAEQMFGVQIVRLAVDESLRQIAFNALAEKFEDLFAAGVIDPTKVTKTALINAASVASLLLTTEAMIADKPKVSSESAGASMGGGMGGMM